MNEPSEYIDISVRAFSAVASSSVVSKLLKLDATSQFEKGEIRQVLKSGQVLRHQRSGWLYRKNFPISETYLSYQIVFILQSLGLTEEIAEALRKDGFDLDVYVGVFNAPECWGFELNTEHLSLFSRLVGRVSFSFY